MHPPPIFDLAASLTLTGIRWKCVCVLYHEMFFYVKMYQNVFGGTRLPEHLIIIIFYTLGSIDPED